MAWTPPSKVGDNLGPDGPRAKDKLDNFSYGAALKNDRSLTYTEDFGKALTQFAKNRNAEVAAGKKPGPAMTPGVFDWAAKKQLGLLEPVAPPPPPKRPRHAALVYRGTGGVVGLDYVSRVCQGAADLVEEINPEFPASMGGLPPGASGQPSARHAIEIGYRAGVRWIKDNPTRTFLLGGYSLGEIVVARLLEALFTPGGELFEHRHRYVASFHIGPPARPLGGGYHGGSPAPGVGIASRRLPMAVFNELGPRACYLCHPDDMYGSVPVPIPGGTGDIMETVYDMVTELELSDFLGTVQLMIPHLLEIAQDAGVFGAIGLGNVTGIAPVQGAQTGAGGLLGGLVGGGTTSGLGGLLGGLGGAGALGGLLGGAGALGGLLGAGGMLLNPVAAIPMLLPLFISAMPGLIAGMGGSGGGAGLVGPAAAAQAAILGMKFLFAGTAPHVNYHAWEVWPGQTYLGLAIQHVRDWSVRVPVR